MATKIYRSVLINGKTKWSYPLIAVEIITDGNGFDVLVYDVGHQPPYYDVSNIGPLLIIEYGSLDNNKPVTPEKVGIALHSREIFIDEWMEVTDLLANECNALIREDIRKDVTELYGYDKKEPSIIASKVAESAIKTLSKYNGEYVEIKIHFLSSIVDYSQNPISFFSPLPPSKEMYKKIILTISNGYYIMFREPSKYNYWGFVCKGNKDDISILVSAEKEFYCLIYDQNRRENMNKGQIVKIIFDFVTKKDKYILSFDGFKKV